MILFRNALQRWILPGVLACWGATACIWMEPDVLGLWYGEEVIDREEAKNELRTAVRLNLATCPDNNTAGLAAIEFHIPKEITHLRYYRQSIENCALSMLLVPCGARIQVETEDQEQVETQIFLPVLRFCNPRPIPESPVG